MPFIRPKSFRPDSCLGSVKKLSPTHGWCPNSFGASTQDPWGLYRRLRPVAGPTELTTKQFAGGFITYLSIAIAQNTGLEFSR